KLYALGGGVNVLEAMLDYFRNPPVVPERPELLPAAELTALRQRLLVQLSVVSRCLPPNARIFQKLALLDEARAVIDLDGGEATFPFLQSPSILTLMNYFGDGVGSPPPSGNSAAPTVLAESDPGCPGPGPNDRPFSPEGKAPAPRKGREKVAVA